MQSLFSFAHTEVRIVCLAVEGQRNDAREGTILFSLTGLRALENFTKSVDNFSRALGCHASRWTVISLCFRDLALLKFRFRYSVGRLISTETKIEPHSLVS